LLFDDEDIKSAEVAEVQFWDTFKESPTISATRLKAKRMAATTVVFWRKCNGIVTLFIPCLESSVEEMLAVGVGAFIPTSASGTCLAFSIFLFVLLAERAAGVCPAVLTTGALVVMLLVLLVGADASTVLPDVEFVVVTLVVAVAVGGCCPCGLVVG